MPTLRIDGFNEEYFTQIRSALQNRLKVIDERSVRNSGREPIGRLPTDEKRAAYLAKAIDDMIENKKYISPQCAMLLQTIKEGFLLSMQKVQSTYINQVTNLKDDNFALEQQLTEMKDTSDLVRAEHQSAMSKLDLANQQLEELKLENQLLSDKLHQESKLRSD